MAKKKSSNKSNSILDDAIGDIIKDVGAKSSKVVPNYPSHIDLLDFRNARIEDNEILAGFNGGKIITIVGKSGSGKSTLGMQIGFSIIKEYDEGQFIHLDYENAGTKARAKHIARKTGIPKEDLSFKYKYLNENIYSETLYKLIKSISKKKIELYDSIKIDSGKVDEEGKPIYVLPPTVLFVDSWASVIPEDISEEDELSGQMSATSIARQNNAIVKRSIGPCAKANIVIIAINHITKKVEIGPVKSTNDLNYMGQDDSTPGGTAIIYMSDSWIKLQSSSKLEEEKDFGIKGFYVNAIYCKTRSNEAGRKFELVFNQRDGFDNFYTNFNYLKKEKYLKGNGRAYYFDFDPDTKFTQKNVKELYESNSEWAEQFDELVKEIYTNFITTSDAEEDEEFEDDFEEEIELVKCINKKKKLWKGSDGNIYYEDGTPYEEDEE